MSVRRLSAALAVIAVSVGLAGCVGLIASDTPEQLDEIGDVRITTDICLGANALGGLFGGDAVSVLGAEAPTPVLECGDFGDGFDPDDLPDLLDGAGAAGAAGAPVRARDASRPTHADLVNALWGGISASQLLVSYRIPAGADAPETIQGRVTVDPEYREIADLLTEGLLWPLLWGYPDGGVEAPQPAPKVKFPTTVTLRRDDTLATGMGDAGAGREWVGYVSQGLPLLTAGTLRLEPDFELPEPPDGSPYAGPFTHETLVGVRVAFSRTDLESLALLVDALDLDDDDIEELFGADILELLAELLDTGDVAADVVAGVPSGVFAAASPDRPVVCDGDPVLLGLNDDLTLCAFEPAVVNDEPLATRDVRVVGGQGAAQQGQTAQVPFQLRFAGPAATRPYSLSGVTNLPFSSATPQNATWTPAANEQRTELVEVPVPADARPGTYEVDLLVEVGDELRLGVGQVVVTPAPGAPPVVVQQAQQQPPTAPITVKIDRLYMGRRSGRIAFGFICPRSLGDACDEVRADMFVNAEELEDSGRKRARRRRARKAQNGSDKFVLTRIGRVEFEARPGRRVRAKMKLSRTARRLIRRGRRISGKLVIRAGGVKQVREVLILRH